MRNNVLLFLGGIATASLVQFATHMDWRGRPNEVRADELTYERGDRRTDSRVGERSTDRDDRRRDRDDVDGRDDGPRRGDAVAQNNRDEDGPVPVAVGRMILIASSLRSEASAIRNGRERAPRGVMEARGPRRDMTERRGVEPRREARGPAERERGEWGPRKAAAGGMANASGPDAKGSVSLRPAGKAFAAADIVDLVESEDLTASAALMDTEATIGATIGANSDTVPAKSLPIENLAITNLVAAVLPGRAITVVTMAGARAHRGVVAGDIAALLKLISAGIVSVVVTDTQAGVGNMAGAIEDFTGLCASAVSAHRHFARHGGLSRRITGADSGVVLAGTEDSCDTMRGVSVFIDGTGCIGRHTRTGAGTWPFSRARSPVWPIWDGRVRNGADDARPAAGHRFSLRSSRHE